MYDGREGRRSCYMIAILWVCFSARPDGINLLLSRLCVNNCSQLGPANRNSILPANSKCAKIPVITSFSLQLKPTGQRATWDWTGRKCRIKNGIVVGHECNLNRLGSGVFFVFVMFFLNCIVVRRACNPKEIGLTNTDKGHTVDPESL